MRRSLNDEMYASISESSKTVGASNCSSSPRYIMEVPSAVTIHVKDRQLQLPSPVRVSAFDDASQPPPIPKRSTHKPNGEDSDAERIVEPTTTSAVRHYHHSLRRHSKSTSQRRSRPSVNMAGLQMDDDSIEDGVIQTPPTNRHHRYRPYHATSRYQESPRNISFNDAPTPPHRNGKNMQPYTLSSHRQLGSVARKLEYDMQQHQQKTKEILIRPNQSKASVVVTNEDIELQADFPEDEVDRARPPLPETLMPQQGVPEPIKEVAIAPREPIDSGTVMPGPQVNTTNSLIVVDEEVVLGSEEVAMEYNEPKRLTKVLIVCTGVGIFILLTAIIFAVWYLIKQQGAITQE